MHTEEQKTKRGPGFWKFNNSPLTDSTYIELTTKSIPEFVTKYLELEDKGLLWEMIKMEIRATTNIFTKRKAKQKEDEELERTAERTADPVTLPGLEERSFAAKPVGMNSEKRTANIFTTSINETTGKKHINSLKKQNNTTITNPKKILEEEAKFFKEIYESKSPNPYDTSFSFFFDSDELTPLQSEASDSCEGLLILEECAKVLSNFSNDKTPGSDGLTIKF